MVKKGRWKHVEPKDSTIVALKTQITNLEKKINTGHAPTGKSDASNPPTPRLGTNFTLENWHIVFNGKEKVVDKKTQYCCPHHKMKGSYDGMYVGHTEDEHDEWVERNKGWKKSKGATTSDDTSSTTSSNTQKLILSNNLKAAMVTNFNYNEAEFNTL